MPPGKLPIFREVLIESIYQVPLLKRAVHFPPPSVTKAGPSFMVIYVLLCSEDLS